MKHYHRIARARHASGRFLFLLITLALACTPPPPGGGAGPEGTLPDPVLEEGRISGSRVAQATRLFGQAQQAFETGEWGEARALAQRIVDEYPRSPVSGRALRLQARSALREGRFDEADAAAGRYAALLEPADPRVGETILLQAAAQEGKGDQATRLARLLQLGTGITVNTRLRGETAAREAVAAVGLEELEALEAEIVPGHPLVSIVASRYAALLLEAGRAGEAEAFARMSLDGGAQGPDSLLATAVLRGEIPGGSRTRRSYRMATVLPASGSPALRDFARRVEEGIEVAAATVLDDAASVEVEAQDDAGDPAQTAQIVRDLADRGLVGAVGFLEDRALASASQATVGALPLISPTARVVPQEGDGVFTLAGPDPQAAASVARYGVRQGIVRAAVVHSRAPESVAEADAIEAALRAGGVPVVGRFAYEVGATFFEPQIMGAQNALRAEEIAALNLGEEDTLHVELLDPVALFLPIPPEDVEYLAPQVTHFGLDTLAIQVMGTSGWTDPQVLEAVNSRHTDGVVATAPVRAGPGSPGYARFKNAYEEYFQRTLVSPVPALGYDAALLLLEGVRSAGGSPAAVRAAMSRLRGVEGATGVFSVVGGQVIRQTEVVRLGNGVAIPIGDASPIG